MPYSTTPIISTYSTQRMPAAYGINLRPASNAVDVNNPSGISQDEGMVNMVPFQGSDKQLYSATRMKIESSTTSAFSGQVRGMYVWEKTVGTIYYFVVVGTSVMTSTDGITFTSVTTLSTSANTPVRFTEFIDDVNGKKLILVDGVEGYVYTSNAAGTKITDADFPTPHVPFPVFLDGYLFLAKAGTGDIYNSDLNDPAIWTAGSFISTELYPDDVQALAKINNYILAIGTQSCEYFYDAANPTASPLQRIDGSALTFGCDLPNTIAANKNTLVFIANNNDGQSIIVQIDGLKYKEVNSSFVMPLLDARLGTSGVSSTYIRGCFFRQEGSLFYLLNFSDGYGESSYKNAPSLVYSFDADMWTEFRQSDFMFPVSFSAPTTTSQLYTYVAGNAGIGSGYFGILKEGSSSTGATDVINTISTPIYMEVRTPNITFGTMNLKTMNRMSLDIETGSSGSGNGVVTISWNDADSWGNSVSSSYISATCNISPGQTDLTSGGFNSYFPFITQMGPFRRRTFTITYSGGEFLRFRGMEFDINKGQR